MRAVLLVAICPLFAANAQTAGGYSPGPSHDGGLEATVHGQRPSPEDTQTRQFTGTRFWLLDAGHYETEVWWDSKHRDGAMDAVMKAEVEIGIAPHLQLDLYQDFSYDGSDVRVEGNQFELRYSFGRQYNEVPLNPVLYLEWHPKHQAQDRAEARLLLGGDAGRRGLWAANLFAETNVNGFNQPGSEGKDMELGATGAFNTALLGEYVRAGAEVKTGVDQHGEDTFYPMLLAGPNLVLLAPKLGLKLTSTMFVGLFDRDPRIELLTIAGWAF